MSDYNSNKGVEVEAINQERSWPDGNYFSLPCITCGCTFFGPKRANYCYPCYSAAVDAQFVQDEIEDNSNVRDLLGRLFRVGDTVAMPVKYGSNSPTNELREVVEVDHEEGTMKVAKLTIPSRHTSVKNFSGMVIVRG